MSTWLMKGLLAEYLVILLVCLYERNWTWALYWAGAAILMISVLLIKIKADGHP